MKTIRDNNKIYIDTDYEMLFLSKLCRHIDCDIVYDIFKDVKEIKEMLKDRENMLKVYDNKFYRYIRNNIRFIEKLKEKELLDIIYSKYNDLIKEGYKLNDIACEIIEDIK